ncbi:hypothetical protein PHET_06251 [Paragonimus heterotremus]|uniref:Endonuclease/exonuclease/phosphatase domain-containing protein n=1 Tax=Paragonimus heterotremus TaxID=100268 RepID=A0A8J4WHL0_9TREM|nr:hypothetical protein PHET_06251 [Paragonimus heterotremus]
MRESNIVKASSVLRQQVVMRTNRRIPAPLKLLPLLDFEKTSFIAPEDYSSTDVPGTVAARDHLCQISPHDQRGWLSAPPLVDTRTFETWAHPGVDDQTDGESHDIAGYLHNDASPDRASTCHLSPDPHLSELNYELSIVSSDEEVFLPDNDHSDMPLPVSTCYCPLVCAVDHEAQCGFCKTRQLCYPHNIGRLNIDKPSLVHSRHSVGQRKGPRGFHAQAHSSLMIDHSRRTCSETHTVGICACDCCTRLISPNSHHICRPSSNGRKQCVPKPVCKLASSSSHLPTGNHIFNASSTSNNTPDCSRLCSSTNHYDFCNHPCRGNVAVHFTRPFPLSQRNFSRMPIHKQSSRNKLSMDRWLCSEPPLSLLITRLHPAQFLFRVLVTPSVKWLGTFSQLFHRFSTSFELSPKYKLPWHRKMPNRLNWDPNRGASEFARYEQSLTAQSNLATSALISQHCDSSHGCEADFRDRRTYATIVAAPSMDPSSSSSCWLTPAEAVRASSKRHLSAEVDSELSPSAFDPNSPCSVSSAGLNALSSKFHVVSARATKESVAYTSSAASNSHVPPVLFAPRRYSYTSRPLISQPSFNSSLHAPMHPFSVGPNFASLCPYPATPVSQPNNLNGTIPATSVEHTCPSTYQPKEESIRFQDMNSRISAASNDHKSSVFVDLTGYDVVVSVERLPPIVESNVRHRRSSEKIIHSSECRSHVNFTRQSVPRKSSVSDRYTGSTAIPQYSEANGHGQSPPMGSPLSPPPPYSECVFPSPVNVRHLVSLPYPYIDYVSCLPYHFAYVPAPHPHPATWFHSPYAPWGHTYHSCSCQSCLISHPTSIPAQLPSSHVTNPKRCPCRCLLSSTYNTFFCPHHPRPLRYGGGSSHAGSTLFHWDYAQPTECRSSACSCMCSCGLDPTFVDNGPAGIKKSSRALIRSESGSTTNMQNCVYIPEPIRVSRAHDVYNALRTCLVPHYELRNYFTNAPPQRQWRKLEELSKDGFPFTLMCYNLLSPSYATPNMYPYCPSWALNWDYRRRFILDEIRMYHANIICLQEVETDQFEEIFKPELKKLNYDAVFLPKSRRRTMDMKDCKKVDGCAIFWQVDKFEKLHEFHHEFMFSCSNMCENPTPLMLNRVMTRDNVALGVIFETKGPAGAEGTGGRQFCVTTGHIHWDPEHSDVKMIQTILWTSELWAYIDQFLTGSGSASERNSPTSSSRSTPLSTRIPVPGPSSPAASMPVILCGDLNSLPDSGVVEFLMHGSLPKTHTDFLNNGFEYMFEDWRLLEKWAVDGDTLRHRFTFDRAYRDSQGMRMTNFTYDFKGMIDYVLYSRQHFRLLGSLDQIHESWFTERKIVGCPHSHFPSDHFALLVELELKPTPQLGILRSRTAGRSRCRSIEGTALVDLKQPCSPSFNSDPTVGVLRTIDNGKTDTSNLDSNPGHSDGNGNLSGIIGKQRKR